MRIEHLKSVDSTNEYIKQFLDQHTDMVVFSDVQTGGKGTKGRSFLSDMGGVFCSILTFPADMDAAKSFCIMTHAAVAVCRTAKRWGIDAEIKWPNDVRAGGKKLAGILIENGLKGAKIDYSIVGIGLNVLNDVSALNGIAVSMKELLPAPPAVGEVCEELLNNYLRPSTFEEYLSFVQFLGEEILVSEGEACYRATASRILPDGRLEVIKGEKVHILSSAEITLFPKERP